MDMITNYPLNGVSTKDLSIFVDERGSFAEVIREDWTDFIDEWIRQASIKSCYPNMVTAWHRHLLGQFDYFLILSGGMKLCAYDDNEKQLVEIVTTEAKPMLIRIPGQYWHGLKAIGTSPSLLIYFTTRLYDYKKPDEEHRPWNDPNIIPKQINGKINDPRANQPWDWFYPPHK